MRDTDDGTVGAQSNSGAEPIEEGERYAKSPLTGNFYRVTKWVDLGDAKIQSRRKEEVDREEAPEKWLEALDDE